MNLRKIKVYGKLRQFLGKSTFEAAVNTPQQACNFIKANFDGVEKHMNKQFYKVKMGGQTITKDLLNCTGQGDIQIIPIAVGSGFIADALEAVFDFTVDLFVDYGLPILGYIYGGPIGGYLGNLASNALSGDRGTNNNSQVSQIDPAIRASYSFSGIQNVSNAGVPIPILYGLVYSGSVIISAGSDSAQILKEA
tara:strand:- start:52 stop:633 length:582 start_codon:yes stop_codon:yes gene_type:complete